ncbi:MAG: hypothetical protein C0624_04805 [Desulfuromonas sp.]|nr:MAG: hypothetical protein C0624_04805 [Desulfuromonas sp.]
MKNSVSIGLIGAGRTGTPLLQELLNYPYITFAGVADLNDSAEGMVLAREKGIATFTDPMALVALGDEIDILVEVSGDGSLKKKIKDAFGDSGNRHTLIMHDLIARLFISVCTRQPDMIPSLHPDDIGVG